MIDQLKEQEPTRTSVEETGLKSEKYKYVIIGGGTAAHAALVAILEKDPEAKVTTFLLFTPLSYLAFSTLSFSPFLPTGFRALY